MKVQTFISQWAMASQAMGEPIADVREYAEWWRMPQSTAYRHLAQFRELFPELETPQPIADAAIAHAEQWTSRGVAGFGSLPAGILQGVAVT